MPLSKRDTPQLAAIGSFIFQEKNYATSLHDAEESLRIAKRCGYINQEGDAHMFLARLYKHKGEIENAKKEASLAHRCATHKIDMEGDGQPIKKLQKYAYVPLMDEAKQFLNKI